MIKQDDIEYYDWLKEQKKKPKVYESAKFKMDDPYRKKVETILKLDPKNTFFQSLSQWKGWYTVGQKKIIDKRYKGVPK